MPSRVLPLPLTLDLALKHVFLSRSYGVSHSSFHKPERDNPSHKNYADPCELQADLDHLGWLAFEQRVELPATHERAGEQSGQQDRGEHL